LLKTRFGAARASSLRAYPIIQLLFVATLAVSVGALGRHMDKGFVKTDIAATAPALQQTVQNTVQNIVTSAPAQVIASAGNTVSSAVAPMLAPRAENVTREAELEDGQTFAELLSDSGASDADAASAMNALAKVYDLRHMQAGQSVTLSFTRTPAQETLTGAAFQPEATKEISIARTAQNTFAANVKVIPVIRQRLAAQVEIHSSLYEAGDRAGVPHAIMASLIRIYSHDIDFQRDIHPGDKFEVLYDQPMTAQGKPVGEGDIVYAAMNVGGKLKPIYRVKFSDNSIDYFDEHGTSIRRTLLRTPVAAAHITSGFGMRMHPILGYSKMHKGVDFGAPIGTPIFAAGTGTIEEIGFKNGYGRYIRIRHNGTTLATAYAHMSRFAANMYRGAHVNQGEVIAYVGMSGRATGPHLHFEVHVNGVQVNPMSVNLPTGRTLDGKLMASFKSGQSAIKQEFVSLLAKRPAPSVNAPVATSSGVIHASADAPAYATKSNASCGLRGGC
jgi:murein DD-endopeptidase MepM/ murein hydrolase activator NlpD